MMYTYNGLGNQLCSFQLLAGLAMALPDEAIDAVYCKNTTGHRWSIQDPQAYQVDTSAWDKHFVEDNRMSLLERLDYVFPNNVVLHRNDDFIKDRLNSNIINCQATIFDGKTPNLEKCSAFSKSKVPILLNKKQNNVFTFTLTWYSKFFVTRTKEMDSEISQIGFVKEYTDLVELISRETGPFNGLHTRLMKDHQDIYRLTDTKFRTGVSLLNNPDLPILVSVDDWNSPLVSNLDSSYVMVHDLILNQYSHEFKQLPSTSRVDLAIVSLLLMTKSRDFIGTPGSTYTTYIQQQRAQIGLEQWKFFPGSSFDGYNPNHKPYSWYSTDDGDMCSWERDWAECVLKYD
jgi:hypothetical protein